MRKVDIMNSKGRVVVERKSKKVQDQEQSTRARHELAKQFSEMMKQAQVDVIGKRDNEGKIFGIHGDVGNVGNGEQTKTQKIYGEDAALKQKAQDRNNMETVMSPVRANHHTGSLLDVNSPYHEKSPILPAVRWSSSVINKNQPETSSRNLPPDVRISMPDLLHEQLEFQGRQNADDLKSTTEINLILQQKLGYASVDQLISNDELRPAQIAKELLDKQKGKTLSKQKLIKKNAQNFLPEKRVKSKGSWYAPKTVSMRKNHPSTTELLPLIPERPGLTMANKQLVSSASRSSLKKKGPVPKQELHYGLHKFESRISRPIDKPVEAYHQQVGLRGQFLGDASIADLAFAQGQKSSQRSLESYKNFGHASMKSFDRRKTSRVETLPTVNQPGSFVNRGRLQGSAQRRKSVQPERVSPAEDQVIEPIDTQVDSGFYSFLTSDKVANSPTENHSPLKTRTRSTSNISALRYQGKQPSISINRDSNEPSDKPRRWFDPTSAEVRKSPKRWFDKPDPKSDKTPRWFDIDTTKVTEDGKKLLTNRTSVDPKRHMSQAAMFAEFVGLDKPTDQQDMDERYGRVVRDYHMLLDNKEKMRSLIEMLAVENDEVLGIQQRLKLKSPERKERLLTESLLSPKTPKTQLDVKVKQVTSDKPLNQSVDVPINQMNNKWYSANVNKALQSTAVQSNDPKGAYSYKQKQTPLDNYWLDQQMVDLELKMDKNDRTVVNQKNFKYLIVQPHIDMGGRQGRLNVKGLDFNEAQSTNYLLRKGPSQLDKMHLNRPTSFDCQRPSPGKPIFDANAGNSDYGGQRTGANFGGQSSSQVVERFNSGMVKKSPGTGMPLDSMDRLYQMRNRVQSGLVRDFSKLSSAQNRQGQRNSEPGLSDRDEVNFSGEYITQNSIQGDDESAQPEDGLPRTKIKPDHIFALSNNVSLPAQLKPGEAALLLVEEEKDDEALKSPERQLGVKPRVNTNNRGAMQYFMNSPFTYVLKKGRVTSTFNYIVNNLYQYGEPLFGAPPQQQKTSWKMDTKVGKDGKSRQFKMLASPNTQSRKLVAATGPGSGEHSRQNEQRLFNMIHNDSKKLGGISRTIVASNGTRSEIIGTPTKEAGRRKKDKKGRKKKGGLKDGKAVHVSAAARRSSSGGAIMETDEEGYSDGSGSVGSAKRAREFKGQSWQDIYSENEQLKQQIASQIAIFEQYLKVALLQQRQKEIEMKRGRKKVDRGIFEGAEVIIDKRTGSEIGDWDDYFEGSARMSEAERVQKRSKEAESKFISAHKNSHAQRLRSLDPTMEFEDTLTPRSKSRNYYGAGTRTTEKKSRVKSASQSRLERGSSGDDHYSQPPKTAISRKSRQSAKHNQASDKKSRVTSGKSTKSKAGGGLMSKVVNFFKGLTGQTGALIVKEPKLGEYGYNLKDDSHHTHKLWLDKIEVLWKKLEMHKNSEAVQLQIQIDQNKKRLNELTRDNIFELEVQTSDQKMLLRAKYQHRQMKAAINQTKEERLLRKVQKKLRREIQKAEEYDEWGLHNYVISLQIKCRMTEEIVDLAQKLQLKSDATLEKKMERLKALREQTYLDLYYFITEREKVHWRNWDHMYMGNYKPEIPPHRNLLQWYKDQCEMTLLQIEFLELQSLQLSDDINGFNRLNAQSIVIVTDNFGHDQWLHFWQIRQLRRNQMKQIHGYDPDQLYLKSLSDPKAHIKYMQYQTQKEFFAANKRKATPGQTDITRDQTNLGDASQLNKPEEALDSAKQREEAARKTVKFKDGDNSQQGFGDNALSSIDGEGRDDANIVLDSVGHKTIDRREEVQLGQATEGESDQQKDGFQPRWLETIQKKQREREQKERQDKMARIARLQKLMDDTENDLGIGELLDKHAVERKMQDYLGKINTHLEVELQLLDAWKHPEEVKESNQE